MAPEKLTAFWILRNEYHLCSTPKYGGLGECSPRKFGIFDPLWAILWPFEPFSKLIIVTWTHSVAGWTFSSFIVACSTASMIVPFFHFMSCLLQFRSYAFGHTDSHGKGCHTSMCTENCVVQPVSLLVAVTMAAFKSICKWHVWPDGKAGQFLETPEPPWSCHCVAPQRKLHVQYLCGC